MDPVIILLLIAGGGIAGWLGAWLGLSEGLILVPLILALEQSARVSTLVSMHIALGTSLTVVAISAWVGAYRAGKTGQITWRVAVISGIASVLSAGAGCVLADACEGKTLQHLFALIAGAGAIRLFTISRKPKGEHNPRLDIPGLAAAGIVAGGFSSLTGVSATMVSVPILYSLRRLPLLKAIGTSGIISAMASTAAVAGYIVVGRGNPFLPQGTIGFVHPLYALPLLVGVLPLALIGARIVPAAQQALSRKLFAIILLVITVRMLFF